MKQSDRPIALSVSPADEIKTTTCYMCACRCGIRVHLRDGEVRYIDGNPRPPGEQGRDLRQGLGRHHEAVLARAPDAAAAAQAGERGAGEFEPISWDEALATPRRSGSATSAPPIPKKFAFFTGRDQMQALTGLFAQQFGTPNYAAHGGFCSVNMAAAGMSTRSAARFWEFGGPDLEHAKFFVMFGTAEDHHSNPLKIAPRQVQARRRPLHLDQSGAHRLLGDRRRVDPDPARHRRLFWLAHPRADEGRARSTRVLWPLHQRRWLVIDATRRATTACSLATTTRRAAGVQPRSQCYRNGPRGARRCGSHRRRYRLDAWPTVRVPRLRVDRASVSSREAYAPEQRRAAITGIPRPRRVAPRARARRSRASTSARAADPLDRRWGKRHDKTCRPPGRLPRDARARGALERLPDVPRAALADDRCSARIDRPGRLPPQAAVPAPDSAGRTNRAASSRVKPNTPLDGAPLGFPPGPTICCVDANGTPLAHRQGVLVGCAALGARPDAQRDHQRVRAAIPYPIDTLMMFMANMAWNSSMNTSARADDAERPRRGDGEYKIPFLVVCDAFQSEMVAFADLVLPDTTYLERHDVMSLLDRPISEFDGAGRLGARAGRAARSRRASRSRTCWSSSARG